MQCMGADYRSGNPREYTKCFVRQTYPTPVGKNDPVYLDGTEATSVTLKSSSPKRIKIPVWLRNGLCIGHNDREVTSVAFPKRCRSITPSAFGLAIQALVYLASCERVRPSQEIAGFMRSGTSFMRRIMAPLVRANLVEAREGRDGGYLLAKPAHLITVADVYHVMQMTDPLGNGILDSTTDCQNGQAMRDTLSEMTTRAEKSVLAVYEQFTIAEIADRMAAQSIKP